MQNKDKWGKYIKSLAKINGKDVLDEVKLPKPRKKRAKECVPRDMQEARFRQVVFDYFNKKGVRYWRIENSIGGRSVGLPDFLVFHHNKMWWVELKSEKAGYQLEGNQAEFELLCMKAGINHIVAIKESDLYIITGEIKYEFVR